MTRLISGVMVAMAVQLAGIGSAVAHDAPHGAAATVRTAPAPQAAWPVALGGPFSLLDQNGRRRSDADFRNDWVLMVFGYADCQSICPVGLQRMIAAVEALGPEAGRVQPLFVTVDPDRDRPAALRAFAARLHPRLIALTGTADELRTLRGAYRVEARVIGRLPDGKPIISHGSFIYLIGPDGRFETIFPPVMGVEAMTAALRRYLARPQAYRSQAGE